MWLVRCGFIVQTVNTTIHSNHLPSEAIPSLIGKEITTGTRFDLKINQKSVRKTCTLSENVRPCAMDPVNLKPLQVDCSIS